MARGGAATRGDAGEAWGGGGGGGAAGRLWVYSVEVITVLT